MACKGYLTTWGGGDKDGASEASQPRSPTPVLDTPPSTRVLLEVNSSPPSAWSQRVLPLSTPCPRSDVFPRLYCLDRPSLNSTQSCRSCFSPLGPWSPSPGSPSVPTFCQGFWTPASQCPLPDLSTWKNAPGFPLPPHRASLVETGALAAGVGAGLLTWPPLQQGLPSQASAPQSAKGRGTHTFKPMKGSEQSQGWRRVWGLQKESSV